MSVAKLKPVSERHHAGPNSVLTHLELIKEQIEAGLHLYETERDLIDGAHSLAMRVAIIPPLITRLFEHIHYDFEKGVEIVRCHEED